MRCAFGPGNSSVAVSAAAVSKGVDRGAGRFASPETTCQVLSGQTVAVGVRSPAPVLRCCSGLSARASDETRRWRRPQAADRVARQSPTPFPRRGRVPRPPGGRARQCHTILRRIGEGAADVNAEPGTCHSLASSVKFRVLRTADGDRDCPVVVPAHPSSDIERPAAILRVTLMWIRPRRNSMRLSRPTRTCFTT